ncbi:ABC transporter permease subunit [Paracoccus yeei]|uniref:ABC transporter permease subunit n=1 Tax=Paracoccus yeei TaxID=147645 RepID=UPI003BF8571B
MTLWNGAPSFSTLCGICTFITLDRITSGISCATLASPPAHPGAGPGRHLVIDALGVLGTKGHAIGPVLIGVLAVIYIPGSYRFARALAVNINTMDYVTVARARGERTRYLILHEILPNMAGPVLADVGLRFVFIVLLLSGLSFLGLGVQPPYADWGSLVRENIGGLPFGAPAVILPSLAIASLTIGVNLLIDNLPVKIRDRSA